MKMKTLLAQLGVVASALTIWVIAHAEQQAQIPTAAKPATHSSAVAKPANKPLPSKVKHNHSHPDPKADIAKTVSIPKSVKRKRAAHNRTVIEGKHYKVIKKGMGLLNPSSPKLTLPNDQIVVREFFSYGCPTCYRIDKSVDQWVAKLPKRVRFERVPVVFHSGWNDLAKAYYTAMALGKLEEMHQSFFIALHEKRQDLSDLKTLQKLFEKHNVKAEQFKQVYQSSPMIDLKVKNAIRTANRLDIDAVPSVTIGDHYVTNIQMTEGSLDFMFKVIDHVIAKVNAQHPQSG